METTLKRIQVNNPPHLSPVSCNLNTIWSIGIPNGSVYSPISFHLLLLSENKSLPNEQRGTKAQLTLKHQVKIEIIKR